MKFNEAIQAIGTVSADAEGIPKLIGKKIVRRPIPPGCISDIRKAKKKKNKKKKDDEEEELKEMFKQLPRAIASLNMSKFWDKGVQYDEEPDDDDDDDPEEMATPTRHVQPNYINKMTDKFWSWDKKEKNWYVGRDDDEEQEDDDDEEQEDDDEDSHEESRRITRNFGIDYPQRSMDPFWRKSHTPTNYSNDYDEDEAEDE